MMYIAELFKCAYRKIIKTLATGDRYIDLLRQQGVIIGDNCDISKSTNCGSEPYLISIGNNVRITQKVQFITHDGGLWTLRKMGLIKKIKLNMVVLQ